MIIHVYLLRNLCREYYSLIDDGANIKKKLSCDLRVYFPGYNNVFSDITGNTSLAILEAYPTPKSILDAPKEDIILLLRKNARKGIAWYLKAYGKLIEAAENAHIIVISSFSFDGKVKRYLNLLSTYDCEIKLLLIQIEETLNSKLIPICLFLQNINLKN